MLPLSFSSCAGISSERPNKCEHSGFNGGVQTAGTRVTLDGRLVDGGLVRDGGGAQQVWGGREQRSDGIVGLGAGSSGRISRLIQARC